MRFLVSSSPGRMAQDVFQSAQRIGALLRGNTQGGNFWADVLGIVELSRGMQQRGLSRAF